MTKKEAIQILIAEVEAHIVGFENDSTYHEVRQAIKKLSK